MHQELLNYYVYSRHGSCRSELGPSTLGECSRLISASVVAFVMMRWSGAYQRLEKCVSRFVEERLHDRQNCVCIDEEPVSVTAYPLVLSFGLPSKAGLHSMGHERFK